MAAHWYDPATGKLVDPWFKGAYVGVSTVLGRVRSEEYEALVARMGQEAADELMDRKAKTGTRVHKACELWVNTGDYDLAIADLIDGYWYHSEPDDIWCDPEAMYLDGFINWWELYNPELIATELFVKNDKYKYGGTVDLIVNLDSQLWVLDIKTGMDNVRHGLQLKMYQKAGWDKARMGVLALTAKNNCGYRGPRKDWEGWCGYKGVREYSEPMSPVIHHIGVHRWWARKKPVTAPKEPEAVWAPEL